MFRLLFYTSTVTAILALILIPVATLAEEDQAQIELHRSRGPVGTDICMNGEGFEPCSQVVISFKTKDNIVQEAETDEAGCFDAGFTVEECTVGTYWVWATGMESEGTAYFTVESNMLINKTDGRVGDEITISGTGFAAEKLVFIYFGDSEIGSSETDVNGSFTTVTFNVPKIPYGEYTIEAEDASMNSDTASFFILPSASLNLKSGIVGIEITVSGTGFAAEKDVTIYFDDDKVGIGRTGVTGTFADATFRLPRSCNGRHAVKAEDADHNSDTKFFSTEQSINLHPKLRSVGIKVTISGTGFRANKNITMIFDGEEVANEPTDRNGSFTSTFIVPFRPNGVYYDIKASDGTNVAYADVVIETSASLRETSGYVGMEVGIDGASFAPNKIVIIKYDGTEVATATISNDGSFSASFIVPNSAQGNHTVTATDGTNTVELIFIVESTAPPVPELALPPSGSKTNPQTYFDWSNVEDISGVTYTIQVASNATFADPVLTKQDLTNSEYTITMEEKLTRIKETPYYWRVRAIDGASNIGNWSTPRSFYIRYSFAMPPWTKYSLTGLGIVLFSFLGFYVMRKVLYHGSQEQLLEQGESEIMDIA